RPATRHAQLPRGRMGLRPAALSRGGRRRGSGARSGALDRTRHANGGPLAGAPLPLPARATAPADTDLRSAAEMIALSLAGAADPALPPQSGFSPTASRASERSRYTRADVRRVSLMLQTYAHASSTGTPLALPLATTRVN